jgi:outer membrane receptor protein involved in Fe transport
LPLLAIAVVGAAAGGLAFAQTTGTIEGTVTDNSGAALPGVTCTATSPALQGSRTAVTGNNGSYRIVAVPPGNYRVSCALAGFATAERPAVVTLGAVANANMTLQISAKEEVVVTGEAPLIDITSTTSGTNYNAKVMEKMPVSRNYADIVRAQPGVNTDTAETQGRSLALTIYGSTSVENLYVIDGVNTTNVIKGFQGKSINPEFIQEVEVKTGGYQAEYGRATGGVINVITKSGGNEFHGDLFGYYNGADWRNDVEVTDEDVQQTEQTEIDRWDAGVDLGGYFIKDRLWFFGAYDRVEQDTDRIPKVGNPSIVDRPFLLKSTSDLWSSKLTWNITQGSTLVGTFFTDPEKRSGAINLPSSPNPVTYEGSRYIGAKDYAGRFNQLFGSFGVLTLQYARHQDRFLTKLTPEGEQIRVNDATVQGIVVASGGFGSIFGPTINNESKRDGYLGTFTAYLANHEIKLGGEYEENITSAITRFTGGQLVRIQACRATPTSADRCAAAGGAGVPFVNFQGDNLLVFYRHDYWVKDPVSFEPLAAHIAEPPSLVYSGYLQDTWRINPRLTVNAGIRWDREEIQNALEQTVIDIDDMWAPRAGFVWDFTGDGTSKVYGSYGRFYYQIPTDLNVRAYGFQLQTRSFNYSPTGLDQDPHAPFARTTQGGVVDQPVDKNLKGMYQDEFTVGAEKALDPTLVVGLKGMYRRLGRAIEDRCDLDYNFEENLFNSCAIVNPGSGEKWASGDFPCNNASERPDRAADSLKCNENGGPAVKTAKRVFRGIELIARKSFSQNFWAQVSYLYSSLRGNYDGAARLASGQTDPGINADYDYFQFAEKNAYGKLYLDRPHQFQLSGIYTAPFGLSVGVSGFVRSGPPRNQSEFFNSFYPNLIHGVKRGSVGRAETEYEANLSLAWAVKAGPVTITPQLYVFNVFDRQGETRIDDNYNPDGDFDPDTGLAIRDVDYGKILQRQEPRLFRAALRIAF